jgi:hypothetical protein
MNKTLLRVGSSVLAAMVGGGAWAADSVAGKTFDLTGKFGGAVAVACKFGGAHSQKIKAQKNLAVTLHFNEDGTFAWSNDALQPGLGATGEWVQNNSKIDLDFDDPSSMSFLQIFGNQQINASSQGANLNGQFSPSKYDFSAKVNAKATSIAVVEKGGFKVDAEASAAGSSNRCKYKVSLNRTYRGTAQ